MGTQMGTVEERVARGIRFLDEKKPGWWQALCFNLGDVDIRNRCNCPYGQVFGIYPMENCPLIMDSMVSMGFTCMRFGGDFEAMDRDFAALEQEWVKQIRVRREAAGVC